MAIRTDPDGNETRALSDIVEFGGQRVLEVGCGDGRVTRHYADRARHVTAIDPDAARIALAKEQLSSQLQGRIEFQTIAFEDFASATPASAFDIVMLARSLC
jgi:2-polyprenyl-3-methyl-5-hydroxy-6-metoxy-1,4-benzoquinol methylase